MKNRLSQCPLAIRKTQTKASRSYRPLSITTAKTKTIMRDLRSSALLGGSKSNRRGTAGKQQTRQRAGPARVSRNPEALLFKSSKQEANKMSLDGKFPDRKNYTFKTISWRVRLAGFVYKEKKKKQSSLKH